MTQNNVQDDPANKDQEADQTLRHRAEERIGIIADEAVEKLSLADTRRLLHELQVHQLELEMQNEELRQTQAALEESRANYFDLYNQAPVGYITLSEQGVIREANLTVASLLGVPRSALVNERLTRFIEPDDQDINYRHRRQLLETGAPQLYEMRMIRADASPFWARVEATIAHDGGSGASVCRTVISDISALKQAEEEKQNLQAQILQTQKLESVGRLAGGVAHDFNNMLGVILGHIDLALMGVGLNHPAYGSLTEIKKAANRSTELVRQLLAFARKQTISPQVLNLNETVADMLKMMRRLIDENIRLVWLPADNLWQIKMDPAQIDQMLANLCINARDAIIGQGEITIETSNMVFDDAFSASHLGVPLGEYVLLAISDTGGGMDRETQAQIFEPFFTTKKFGQGTGLGLASVYGVVKQNSGFINVFSQPGRGTTFRIYIPRYLGAAATPRPEGPAEPLERGQDTVLLVEDDPAVLGLVQEILNRLGYTVLAASRPAQAIRLAADYDDQIQLLITDVIMPEMNGRELARQLSSHHPGLKQLFMSGYNGDIISNQGVLDDQVHFISKPFTMTQMATKVRTVLNQK